MTVYTGAPTTLVAGDTSALVTKFNDHRDALKAATEAWTAYVPTLTGFTLGNGTMTARYRQLNKTVDVWFRFVAGSTSTFSSTMILSLPVAAHASHGLLDPLGTAAMFDNSAGSGSRTAGVAVYDAAGGMFFLADRTAAGAATVTNAAPWTWATSDTLSGMLTYEAA